MNTASRITFYHAPYSRSRVTFLLLEELGIDYDLKLINLEAGEQRHPEYLAVNPMGKVPAIRHGSVVITEQLAIMLYLTDLYPQANLAPGLLDPRRGEYLRWMMFYASTFEPALMDRMLQREPAPPARTGYGSWEDVLRVLTDRLRRGDYILGADYGTADVLWGGALAWATKLGVLPDSKVIQDYIERFTSRPAIQRGTARNEELALSLKS